MMVRFVCIVAFTLVSLAEAAPAKANWLKAFARSVARDTKRRNCWPKPFTCPDRYAVQAPFAVMVGNGWRLQNMLGDHHFSTETGALTEAARLKIRWILTEAPQQQRTIYVHRAETAEQTAARIDSVQQYAAQLLPEGPLPPVLETSISARGWDAEEADVVRRKWIETMPEPRLPARGEASTDAGL